MRDRTVVFACVRTAGYVILAAVAAVLALDAAFLQPVPLVDVLAHPGFWVAVTVGGVFAIAGELGVQS